MIFTFFVEELIGGIFRAKSPSLCCSCRLGSKKILILDNRVRIVLSSTPLSTNSCVPLSSCREFKYSRRARRSCCSCSNWALLLGCRPLVICHCPGVWHKSHRRRDAEDESGRLEAGRSLPRNKVCRETRIFKKRFECIEGHGGTMVTSLGHPCRLAQEHSRPRPLRSFTFPKTFLC